MKAGVFNPNWEWLGGGERYTATAVRVLMDHGYKVDIWSTPDLSAEIRERFNIDLAGSTFIPTKFTTLPFIERLQFLARYDVVFWVSDGGLPLSVSRKTIVHFQIPFHSPESSTLANRLKAKMYTLVSNSLFTKSVVDKNYGVDSHVLYPPVATTLYKPGKKENLIVSLARFSQTLHAKRQDVLIDGFRIFSKTHKNWKLVLAGGAEDQQYLSELKSQANGLPIEFVISPSQIEVQKLLSRAKLFWSATGYGVDANVHPEQVEHFGITVVEAMSAGAVPVVYNAGGHKETVDSNQNGFLWENIQDLSDFSSKIAEDHALWISLSQNAKEKSTLFDVANFTTQFGKMI